MSVTTAVFDAYGTLFDVAAAARLAAAEPGGEALREHWPTLARDWRLKQLSYTWLRAVAGRHADFWQVTEDALDWALEAAGLDSPDLRERLLALYWELEAYPEVPEMLAALRQRGVATAILSNGSPGMLQAAVAFGRHRRSARCRAVGRGGRRLQAAATGSTTWSEARSAATGQASFSSRRTAGTRPARRATALPPPG